jgi:hypothetical protein
VIGAVRFIADGRIIEIDVLVAPDELQGARLADEER